MAVPERPIFLIGAPRSGTTLMRYVLCSHPRIYIPPESNFIPRMLARDPCNELRPAEAVRMFETVSTYRSFFKDWRGPRLSPPAFVQGLPDLLPTTLVDALYSEYSRQHGATRWGDKSPIYTMHVDALAHAFSTGQFIHIIRDGRDVAVSMQQTYRGARFFYIDAYYAACSWRSRVRHASASGARLDASRYFELRYEDLVAEPEKMIRAICSFLGEEYDPVMTMPSRQASRQYHSKGIHAATRKSINTGRSGRWRSEMSSMDQRLVQHVAGDLLRDLGYELVDLGPMTATERMRLTALRGKYTGIQLGRRALQSAGVFHPTSLLDRMHLGKFG